MGKLKAITLNKLPPGMHPDGGGLYLCVGPSGSRSWILRITTGGKRRTMGLGSLSTKALVEAREEAVALRARVRKGEDVFGAKLAEEQATRTEEHAKAVKKRVVPTFKQAAKAYHALLKPTFNSPLHSRNWWQSLETHIFPTFGSKTVDTVDSADILQAIGKIWNTVPDTANRTLRRVKAVLDFCLASKFRSVMVGDVPMDLPNPCDGIRKALPAHKLTPTHHEALPYEELPAFIKKLHKANSAMIVKLAFEFLILSAARTGEVLNARWDEIDFEKSLWVVPSSRMKMQVEHEVPLSPRAVEILQLAKQFNDAEIIFPGRKAGMPLSNTALLMCLRRMGYETLTGHGFRATFKTWSEETTEFDSLVIEASLAHAVKGIERSYLRTSFPALRRKLMERWAAFATNAPAQLREDAESHE